jgi:hypothetical protein
MKRAIITYEVPVTKLSTGSLEVKDKERKQLGELEEVEINKPHEVGKIGVDLGQENQQQIEAATEILEIGQSSTINLKYLQ